MKPNALVSPGLVKSSLRRFWPLWLVLFVGLALTLVAPIYSAVIDISHYSSLEERINGMSWLWYSARIGSLAFATVAPIVVAVAFNECLFDSRAATFVGSLPLKRRTAFASNYAVGLLAMLALVALTALCLVPLRLMVGTIFSLAELVKWFVLTSVITFVMYAFAQLACQLAGTRAVAVLLYALINSLAFCIEAAVHLIVSALQYGLYEAWDYISYWLAPVLRMGVAIYDGVDTSVQWPIIVGYVLVAALVTVASAALFGRRNLEAAGESVAIPVLRPILKYLAGVSMALLFGSVFCTLRYLSSIYGIPVGTTGAIALTLCLVLGGSLGLLFAEMIMSRSAHVLGRCWKGALVLAALLVAFVGLWRFDLLGVAHRVPDPSQVEQAIMLCDYNDATTFESAENIADVCDLQRDIIAYGGVGDASAENMMVHIDYQLKNGRVMRRSYPIISRYAEYRAHELPADEGALIIDRYCEIANTQEGRASRYAYVLDAKSGTYSFTLDFRTDSATGEYASIKLNDKDAADFVQNALRPDLLEEPAGEVLTGYGVSESVSYDASVNIENKKTGETPLWLQLDSVSTPHIISWLLEHYPDTHLQTW